MIVTARSCLTDLRSSGGLPRMEASIRYSAAMRSNASFAIPEPWATWMSKNLRRFYPDVICVLQQWAIRHHSMSTACARYTIFGARLSTSGAFTPEAVEMPARSVRRNAASSRQRRRDLTFELDYSVGADHQPRRTRRDCSAILRRSSDNMKTKQLMSLASAVSFGSLTESCLLLNV
jgi:hypothetical protein